METQTIGELCFNTSMFGYQEILTDPSYSNQIITFTFPHIGNVGANKFDTEAKSCMNDMNLNAENLYNNFKKIL